MPLQLHQPKPTKEQTKDRILQWLRNWRTRTPRHPMTIHRCPIHQQEEEHPEERRRRQSSRVEPMETWEPVWTQAQF
jgi:hypothetical protein